MNVDVGFSLGVGFSPDTANKDKRLYPMTPLSMSIPLTFSSNLKFWLPTRVVNVDILAHVQNAEPPYQPL